MTGVYVSGGYMSMGVLSCHRKTHSVIQALCNGTQKSLKNKL